MLHRVSTCLGSSFILDLWFACSVQSTPLALMANLSCCGIMVAEGGLLHHVRLLWVLQSAKVIPSHMQYLSPLWHCGDFGSLRHCRSPMRLAVTLCSPAMGFVILEWHWFISASCYSSGILGELNCMRHYSRRRGLLHHGVHLLWVRQSFITFACLCLVTCPSGIHSEFYLLRHCQSPARLAATVFHLLWG